MPPKPVEDQPVPIVGPSTAGNSANAPTQKRETRAKNHGDRLRRYIEEKGRIPVIFRKKDGHPVGKYARIFMTELGIAVKKFAPLQVSSWKKITEKQKRPIFDQLKSAFVVDFGIGPSSVRKETDKLMSICYRNNRVKMHKHYKTLTELPWEDRLKQVPKEYCNSEEDWEFLCTVFESRTFKDQSAVNSTNRANLLSSYHGGSKSLVQYTYERGGVPLQKDRTKKDRIKKHRVKKTDIGTKDVRSQSVEEVDVVDQACDQVQGKRRQCKGGDGNGPRSAKSTPSDATSCEATNSGLRDELASTKNELRSTRTALESAEDKIRMLEANQKRLEEIIQANQRMMMQVFERIAPEIVQSLTQHPSSAAPPPSSL